MAQSFHPKNQSCLVHFLLAVQFSSAKTETIHSQAQQTVHAAIQNFHLKPNVQGGARKTGPPSRRPTWA